MSSAQSISITSVAGTLAALMGIAPPEQARAGNEILIRKAREVFAGAKADRLFLYNPDAVAHWLYEKYTALFAQAILHSSVQMPLESVMPSVTPVCFASMYSGALPEVHGIQTYEKPVLRIDTLFDALIRAGKRPVIISTEGNSMSKIFLEREMDYFIYPTHQECHEKAMELVREDRHDALFLYNPEYDATMHRLGPEAPGSLAALRENVAEYGNFVQAIRRHWGGHKTFVGFCPDHGCHEIDGGLGSHGLDMREDMHVIHFYQFL